MMENSKARTDRNLEIETKKAWQEQLPNISEQRQCDNEYLIFLYIQEYF